MKKYVWLAIVTCLAVVTIFGIKTLTVQEAISVKLITVEPQTVQQTVRCTGKVQAAESQPVYVEIPYVAKEVYVKEGQAVSKGDVLFSVDAEATRQALSQLAGALPGGVTEVTDTTVKSPVSGVVASVSVCPGEIVDYTQPCATIASGEGMEIAVAIRERYLPRVQIGQKVIVTGVAFSKEQYSGTLTTIASSAHQEYIGSVSETVVDAVISLDEGMTDASLRSGLNAEAEIITQIDEDVLLIPYDCITQNAEGEECVYVYQGSGVAEQKCIEAQREYADGVLVVSGVSAGERLVQAPENLSGKRVAVQAE